MTILGDLYNAQEADIRIATNYRASGHTADMYLAGRLTWEEAQRRWRFHAVMREAAWDERRAISERIRNS